ncbi:[Protein ADP-ribosylarginine] hydrolase [Takifugu flavidus]|uniref:[Protein ADP-ribosylarginine] hydrolase n=1 Tax=Takifugu flavidus TaxID=433684 RepID=A0A5C6PSE2_9TELE|nr:[Protein ADP-ribosylarginine] hydrolase [Takifugu flavidus]
MDGPATLEHYKAAMVLSGAGDALGYRNKLWEYNESGPAIHQEVKELGGLKNIRVELPDWPDDALNWYEFTDRVLTYLCRPATLEHYKAAMVLSGAGDALGYRNKLWEFNMSGPAIHQEVKELGGLKNIRVELPDWPGRLGRSLHEVAARYVEGMKDMDGRAPGNSTIWGVSQLKPGEEGGYRVPYNVRGVAVETGRMTHPHPTGFLGAVASALFTAYAVQRRPVTTWGLGLIKEALPVAQNFVQGQGFAVAETERDWGYFGDKWQWYLNLRGISNGRGPVIWPANYGPAERDKVYKTFSLSGWAGCCGHDAPMIALDALLGAGSDWEELMSRAAFHGGDSDSTAVIACCLWGLLYGFQGVPKGNYSKLEYRNRLEKSAEQLYALSH